MAEVNRDKDGLWITFDEYRVRLDVIDANIVRVRVTKQAELSRRQSWILAEPTLAHAVAWEIEESKDYIHVSTNRLRLRVNAATGAFTWFDATGNLLTREPNAGGKHLEPVAVEKRVYLSNAQVVTEHTADGVKARTESGETVIVRTAYHTRLDFVFDPCEAIYGLGQHEEGILDYRGHWQALYQQNLKVAMPAIVSTRGYGILWNTTSLAIFHDDVHGSYFYTDVDDELDYFFIAGPEFDAIIAGIRALSGPSALFPRWAYGFIQSRERYQTQEELITAAREHRERRIPLDCIVQDWRTWQGDWWGDKVPDPARYPDVGVLVKNLHDMNVRLMVSIWPHMVGDGSNHVEMEQHGYLLGNGCTYDAFNPEARALYWRQVQQGWGQYGVDAWWCDCTEPFEADWSWTRTLKPEPWDRVVMNTAEAKKFIDPEDINAYSMAHSSGIYAHQRAASPDKRVVILTRSALPGQQRYGAITWSGDISATWATLRRQIADGLNFCITGNPKWTLDIGAFFVDRKSQWFWQGDFPKGCDDAGYRELYVRWFQFGAFLPMFRTHGTDTPREVWHFGKPGDVVYDTLVRFIRFRYRLLPYVYSLAAHETLSSYTMFRMLAFDFRHDPHVYDIADQFLLGPALMVCPISEPMYFGPGSRELADVPKSRRVYLPRGCDWYDFWTGKRYEGGQTIEADAPLDRLPLFAKAGSVLPLGPEIQHSGEKLDEAIELRVYPGQDGTFRLYFDANDGYGYEQGKFEVLDCVWSEHQRQLHFEPRRGTYPGQPLVREFHLVIVREGHGVDLEPTASPDSNTRVEVTSEAAVSGCEL